MTRGEFRKLVVEVNKRRLHKGVSPSCDIPAEKAIPRQL